MSDTTSRPEHSRLLQEILSQRDVSEFFEGTWQRKPEVFPFLEYPGRQNGDHVTSGSGDGSWNHERMSHTPLREMVDQRWYLLRQLLHSVERLKLSLPEHERPLIFHERELQTSEDTEALYGSSLFSPYLNGCSIVVNHGDLLSPWIAAACEDLQKTFPHAYANCYVTPPHSQAVPPHADDRDVFVIQLVGSKDWKVYGIVPVPFPYPQEQVGKQGLEVPPPILNGPLAISTTLRPGDVLYMPRGFVHEASCSDSLSLHVTVALATHDWSLAGLMSIATEAILTRTVEFRKSILPLAPVNDVHALQRKVDMAMEMFRKEITAENILENLKFRLDKHNHRAFSVRTQLIREADSSQQGSNDNPSPNTGFLGFKSPYPAATATALSSSSSYSPPLSFNSRIRASTPEERAMVQSRADTSGTTANNINRGLAVRENIADSIMGILAKVKAEPSVTYSVLDLRSLMPTENDMVCDLTLLSLATRAVELGAFCWVTD